MATYMLRDDQIGFEDPRKADDNWVRADVYEDGVGFDRGGLCKLTATECRVLADWLLWAAKRMDTVQPPPTKPAKTAKPRGRGRPCKVEGAA